ncbi:hypothetical protein [Baekduia sp. Peel2402]|uniref:hypothetical protein n=1 Tax=Baekduia sp. Peel2402 TaxID=3458296 RepID=UPI00403E65AF
MSSFDPTDPRSLARRAATYALASEESANALAQQERTLADLRGRGAGLIATAAVAMSIFGGPALGGAHAGPAVYVAIAAFVGACVCVLALLWPRHPILASDGAALISAYAEPHHVPLALVHRELALHRTAEFVRNRDEIKRMTRLSRGALALLSAEIVAWVVNYTLAL